MTTPHPQQTARRRATVTALVLTGGLLAACSSGQDQEPMPDAQEQASPVDYDPQPRALGEQLPEAQAEEVQIPTQLEGRTLVDTGWGTPPQESDGVFLAPGDTGGKLTFTAIDSEGTALWEAERPLSCTGFTITSDGDRTLSELSDIDEDDEINPLGAPTVSAYDLHTGEEVWGPVEVPGPHQGPGMLFAAPPAESFGDLGPAVVLDPTIGEILFDETEEEDLQVLGEHHGTILVARGGELQAFTADSEDPEWTVPLSDLGWEEEPLRATLGQAAGHTSGILIGPSAEDRALIGLQDGEILGENLQDAAQDPTSGTWITLGEQMTGISPEGEEVFATGLQEDMSIEVVGGALAYLRSPDGLHYYNVVSGDQAHAYGPDGQESLAVPTHITNTGVGALQVDDQLLLATSE